MAYTGAYVFGDSLVDSGNALKLAKWYGNLTLSDLPDGAPTPDKGYFEGRFSNGYVFADLLSNKAIGLVTKPVFPFGMEDPVFGFPIDPFAGDPTGNNLNFGYGGAQIRQGDEVVPELDAQTDAFRDAVDGDAPPGALYMITMGGNDIRSLAPAGSDPASVADAHRALDLAAGRLLNELTELVEDGAHHILLTGIPNVGLIPAYDLDGNGLLQGVELTRSTAATQYSVYLDTLVRTEVLPALQAMGANVTYVPLMDYTVNGVTVTGALNANLPTIAALNGLPASALTSNLLQHDNLLFFDQVHPNAQAHALLASYMQARLTGTPWVETMPLLGDGVDYVSAGAISAAGEVDRFTVAMVAGTTYTFQMLGVSTVTPYVLGQLDLAALSGMVLADPTLRLVSSGGSLLLADDDSGIGLDALLSYNSTSAGNMTLEVAAVGSLTGSYVLTATVSGAAMSSGDVYTVSNASTLVLEGVGGAGVDVVRASVSYALAPGSEIEELRTTNDRGKGAINLTGNEFDQTIVGNSGANVLEGKGGADVMTGGAGNDRFVLSKTAVDIRDGSEVDTITDYGKGDVVDVTQILSVAGGTNVVSGGYVRVTTSGLVQVDVDGGGNDWATLSTINGTGAVTVRYLSGGSATTVSLTRVNDPLATISTATVLSGAVAAAGLMAMPLAAEPTGATSEEVGPSANWSAGPAAGSSAPMLDAAPTLALDSAAAGAQPAERLPAVSPVTAAGDAGGHDLGAALAVTLPSLAGLLAGTDAPAGAAWSAPAIAAQAVAMPAAEAMLAAAAQAGAGEPRTTAEVERVLMDALDGGGASASIDALLSSLPASSAPAAAIADAPDQSWADTGAMLALMHPAAIDLDAALV